MPQTLPTSSLPLQEPRAAALLSDEAFEQLYDLVALCGKRPAFTAEGELVLVLAPGGAHNGIVQGVTHALIDRTQHDMPRRYWVYQERNIRLSPNENPLVPDIAIYERELRYTETSPVVTPLVAIEVGLSTIQHDHTIKGPRYAQAGVAELWLITMPDLMRFPLVTGYALDERTRTYRVTSHAVMSPTNGIELRTIPLRIEGPVLAQSLLRYGIPISELHDWTTLPAARLPEESD